MSFDETRQEQLEYLGIKAFHDAGYKGQGMVVMNLEDDEEHGAKTKDVIELIAPEATIISQEVNALSWLSVSDGGRTRSVDLYCFVDNARIPLEQFIVDNDISIISCSLYNDEGTDADEDHALTKEYLRIREFTGVVLFNSAGNEGSNGMTTKIPFDACMSIGALYYNPDKYGVKRALYSSIGEDIDFACTTFGFTGTSFSTPAVAAMSCLIMQRYGKMNHEELYAFLKKISVDIDAEGFDVNTGHGMPVLPDPRQIEVKLQIGNKTIYVDGYGKEMDVAPFIDSDRTFVPIRFVSEALGYDVEWDDSTKQVTIRGRNDG